MQRFFVHPSCNHEQIVHRQALRQFRYMGSEDVYEIKTLPYLCNLYFQFHKLKRLALQSVDQLR